MNTPLATRPDEEREALPAPLEDGESEAPGRPSEAESKAATAGTSVETPAKKGKKKRGKRYKGLANSFEERVARQLEGRFDGRVDKDDQVRLPHADARHWKRVRFVGVDHLTGFQYGEDRDFVTGAFALPSESPTSEGCLADFEANAFRKLERYSGAHSRVVSSSVEWKGKTLPVRRANLKVRVFFSSYEYAVAWTAYPAYPDGCLVFAVAASRATDPRAAERVVLRYAREAFPLVETKTEALPFRKP